jgi:hypothetical protein
MAPTITALTVIKATPNTQSKDHNPKNTSTLCKASVDATTSPGVIQPPTVGSEAENIRPPPTGISAEGTSPLNQDRDRDARAYERERQRMKRAGEWAKRRARKATSQGTTGVGRPGAVHSGRRSKGWRDGKGELDMDLYAALPRSRDKERTTAGVRDEWSAGLLKGVSLPPSGGGGTASDSAPAVRINLSELVVVSHKRHRKRNADGFEVIPPIRSVIALDDAATLRDMDIDESWEHIYANDGEGKTSDKVSEPSYARVVGAGCQ